MPSWRTWIGVFSPFSTMSSASALTVSGAASSCAPSARRCRQPALLSLAACCLPNGVVRRQGIEPQVGRAKLFLDGATTGLLMTSMRGQRFVRPSARRLASSISPFATCMRCSARCLMCGATRSGWFFSAKARRSLPKSAGRRIFEAEFRRDRVRLDGGQFGGSGAAGVPSRIRPRRAAQRVPPRRPRPPAVFRGGRLAGHLDAAGMQLFCDRQIVERDCRPRRRSPRLFRRHEQVVEQRSEIAFRAGAVTASLLPYPENSGMVVVWGAP